MQIKAGLFWLPFGRLKLLGQAANDFIRLDTNMEQSSMGIIYLSKLTLCADRGRTAYPDRLGYRLTLSSVSEGGMYLSYMAW